MYPSTFHMLVSRPIRGIPCWEGVCRGGGGVGGGGVGGAVRAPYSHILH